VALSVLWVILSLGIIYGGYSHCKAYSYSYSLSCKDSLCTWTARDENFLQYSKRYNDNPITLVKLNTISFPKHDLLDAEMVRIDNNGEFADAATMRTNKYKKYGYSFRMRARL
jgi:hypothetical protein